MMTQCTMNPGETGPDTDICVPIYVACAYICKYFMYISQPEFTLAVWLVSHPQFGGFIVQWYNIYFISPTQG